MAGLIRFLIRRFGAQKVHDAYEKATGAKWSPTVKIRSQIRKAWLCQRHRIDAQDGVCHLCGSGEEL